jgi:hypothetical protein
LSKINRFALSPSVDYDFTVGGEMFRVGCFSWYSDDLLDNLSASTAAALTGQKSVDNIRRSYPAARQRRVEPDREAKKAIRLLDQLMVANYNSMKPRVGSSIQSLTFDQAMIRAFATIKNTLYMARRGYVFETAMLARGFIEQAAWARAASRVENEKGLFEINIHKEISFAKSIYPTLGHIYGELSRYSHFDAKLHSLFYTEADGTVATLLADESTKFLAMQWPFVIIDIWLIFFEEFYISKLTKLDGLTKSGKLKKRRFPIQLFNDYFGRGAADRRYFLFS